MRLGNTYGAWTSGVKSPGGHERVACNQVSESDSTFTRRQTNKHFTSTLPGNKTDDQNHTMFHMKGSESWSNSANILTSTTND